MSVRAAITLACLIAGVGFSRASSVVGGVPAAAGPLFREAAHETGLRFTHEPGITGDCRLPEILGSGVALLDYDTDGDLDVYLVQGSPGARTSSRLFQNRLAEEKRLA